MAEALAESAVPLFDEKTDIEVLPDGCAYVDDDSLLDDTLVRRYGGKLYTVEVSAAMLEDAEDGISVMDCAEVVFAGDITPALLKEKLVSLTDCACVNCTEQQRPVIEAIAQDVAHISCGGEEEESEEAELDGDTVSINAVSYTL